jgi:Kef-type K+ transport system membrane component KefB
LFSRDKSELELNQPDIYRGLFSRRSRYGTRWRRWLFLLFCFALVHDYGFTSRVLFAAEESGGGHSDPAAPVLLAIVLILLLAKVGGDLFERIHLPAVLGELTVGVILGNFTLLTGSAIFEQFFHMPHPMPDPLPHEYMTASTLQTLASIGVILLLFEVGLESTIREMMSVGVSSLLVAILGVVAPMGLGWLVGYLLIPEQGWQVHSFIGATLCATSVGITARVLKDLNQHQAKEAKIILGAAVIDDVLGLIVLAVVSGVITSSAAGGASGSDSDLIFDLIKIIGLAVGFLIGAMIFGALQLPRTLFRSANFLRGHGLLVTTALVICFGFSYMANLMGLAPIIGAFAAGLILEGTHYHELGKRENHNLEDALAPLSALLVPIFFVMMGTQVDLESFADPSVWKLAAAITFVAIIGKQVCSLGVREKGLNKIAVGLGMIPRGEVGLIFANEGSKLVVDGEPVINSGTYSAVVVMVMITTMVTPPLLKWSLMRDGAATEKTDPGT